VAGLHAQLARARAEADGRSFAAPPGLPPEAAPFWAQQKTLFDQRAAQRAAQLKGFDEKIGTAEATLAKLAGDQARFVAREKITRQVEEMRASLYKSGASSLVSLLQASDDRLKLLQSLDNGQGGIAEGRHQAAGLRADRDAFERGWKVALDGEIVAAQNGLDAAAAALEKAVRRQDLVRLVAPRPAVVLSLSKLSVGSVLKPGDELMQLAPLDAPVEAEVHLNARDIGFVRVGDPVTLKVAAFNSYEHGEGEGRLTSISENAFTDGPADRSSHYRARVSIDALHFHGVLSDFRLVPGMTLVAEVHVGSRSAFTYVMGSLSHGYAEAMRGP
jgi:HlyD family secretion protein